MRTLSFVGKIEYNLSKANTVISSNLCLEDVDEDKKNELSIGIWEKTQNNDVESDSGKLLIFKNKATQPWRHATIDGIVLCIAVGDVFGISKKSIVAMCADGPCFVYNAWSTATPSSMATEATHDAQATATHHSTSGGEEPTQVPHTTSNAVMQDELVHIFQQKLPLNCKNLLISDIDNDGRQELVVGYSDRLIRSFRWVGDAPNSVKSLCERGSGHFVQLQKWELAGQIGNISIHCELDDRVTVLASQPGGSFVALTIESDLPEMCHEEAEARLTFFPAPPHGGDGSASDATAAAAGAGAAALQSRQSRTEVIGNVARSKPRGRSRSEAQRAKPTGTTGDRSVAAAGVSSVAAAASLHPRCASCVGGNPSSSSFSTFSSSSAVRRSSAALSASTSDMAAASADAGRPAFAFAAADSAASASLPAPALAAAASPYCAVCTVDGRLMLRDSGGAARTVLWSTSLNHELFGLTKLDLTNDDAEEVIVCSWDGTTYIVNHRGEVVRFLFGASCQAFAAGFFYHPDAGRNMPVLVYATFEHKLVLFYKVDIDRISCLSPQHIMLRQHPHELRQLQRLHEQTVAAAAGAKLTSSDAAAEHSSHNDQNSSGDEAKNDTQTARASDEANLHHFIGTVGAQRAVRRLLYSYSGRSKTVINKLSATRANLL